MRWALYKWPAHIQSRALALTFTVKVHLGVTNASFHHTHIFGLWEEVREYPRGHWQNMQTPHREAHRAHSAASTHCSTQMHGTCTYKISVFSVQDHQFVRINKMGVSHNHSFSWDKMLKQMFNSSLRKPCKLSGCSDCRSGARHNHFTSSCVNVAKYLVRRKKNICCTIPTYSDTSLLFAAFLLISLDKEGVSFPRRAACGCCRGTGCLTPLK